MRADYLTWDQEPATWRRKNLTRSRWFGWWCCWLLSFYSLLALTFVVHYYYYFYYYYYVSMVLTLLLLLANWWSWRNETVPARVRILKILLCLSRFWIRTFEWFSYYVSTRSIWIIEVLTMSKWNYQYDSDKDLLSNYSKRVSRTFEYSETY